MIYYQFWCLQSVRFSKAVWFDNKKCPWSCTFDVLKKVTQMIWHTMVIMWILPCTIYGSKYIYYFRSNRSMIYFTYMDQILWNVIEPMYVHFYRIFDTPHTILKIDMSQQELWVYCINLLINLYLFFLIHKYFFLLRITSYATFRL